jgi:hypothetical protein
MEAIKECAKLILRLEEYEKGMAHPGRESFKEIKESLIEIIDTLYDAHDYEAKMSGEKRDVGTAVVVEPNGDVWKSDNVPHGEEVDTIIRLLNYHKRGDHFHLVVTPPLAMATMNPDNFTQAVDWSKCTFRKVDKLRYERARF